MIVTAQLAHRRASVGYAAAVHVIGDGVTLCGAEARGLAMIGAAATCTHCLATLDRGVLRAAVAVGRAVAHALTPPAPPARKQRWLRVPLDPLYPYLDQHARLRHQCAGRPDALARLAGCSLRTAHRSLTRGWLIEEHAEAAAVRLGLHPLNLWPDNPQPQETTP